MGSLENVVKVSGLGNIGLKTENNLEATNTGENGVPPQEPSKLKDLDDLLPFVGDFGWYQRILFILMVPYAFFFAFVYFAQIFMTLVPAEHWCYVPELGNLSVEERRHLSIPKADDSYDKCLVFDVNWTEVLEQHLKEPDLRWPVKHCQDKWEFNYTDIPYETIATQLGWVCDRDEYPATSQAVFFCGAIVGGLVFGWIADKYGRVPALLYTNVIGFVAGVGTAFSNSFWSFCVCRFLVGLAYDNCFIIMYIIATLKEAIFVEKNKQNSSSSEMETIMREEGKRKIKKKYRDDSISPPPIIELEGDLPTAGEIETRILDENHPPDKIVPPCPVDAKGHESTVIPVHPTLSDAGSSIEAGSSTFSMVVEYVGPKWRTFVANMSIAVYFTFAACLLPWIALAVADWQIYSLIVSVPLGLAVFTPWLVPESARWLISQGRIEEAIDIMKKVERINRKKIPDAVIAEFRVTATEIAKSEQEIKNYSVADLLKSPRLRRHTLLLMVIWMSIAMVFDGHVRNVGSLGLDMFLTFTVATATEFPADVLLILILDRAGRRWVSFGSMTLSGVFSFLATTVPVGIPSASLAIIGRFAVNISFNIGMQYAAELLPTVVRAQGLAVIHIMGYVATILVPYIVYMATIATVIPLLILGALGVFGGCLCLLLPESTGKDMPRTIQDGENYGRNQKFWSLP